MRTFAFFSRCQPKLQSQQLPSDSFMDHTTTIIKLFFLVNCQMQFGKMTIHYFVVITQKYNGDLSRRTSYERLKSFQFF